MLSTSQPTISEHIKNLEKGLGCKLFDRLGRTIRPTRKAQILYPKALAIIEDIETLEEELALEEQNISGELIIGASTIPGAYLLPHFANAFKCQHSETSFEIRIADSGEIIDSVLNHDILLGFVGNKFQSKNLQFDPFLEDELILAAAPQREIEDVISLGKLLQTPFLMRENGSGTRKTIEDFFIENRLDMSQLKTIATLGSNAAIKEGVKENLGVSILSKISIRDELACGLLKEIKIKKMRMKRIFYAITHKKRTLPRQYTVFLEQLLTSVVSTLK
jgi:DNA-binding transcriptional LysR family regulator